MSIINHMNPAEKKIYDALAKKRTSFFSPLNKVLTRLGINADILSYLGVGLMIVFIYEVNKNLKLAFW